MPQWKVLLPARPSQGEGEDRSAWDRGGVQVVVHVADFPISPQRSRMVIAMTLPLAVVLLFTSCVVTSIYPFYTDQDLVFEQSLLGDWVDASTTNDPAEYVRVERLGEKGYSVTAFTTSETNGTEAHLFRVKQQLFLDVFPTNRSLDYVPVHQVSKVTAVAPEVKSATLNYDWLAKLLEKKPGAIRHLLLPDKPGDTQGGRLVLSASTAQLQRFILKHLDNTNAWNEPSKWKHRN